jgi:uncharacterized protein
MTLFFTMLPLYLFGNLHCIGMCGPLAMMIGMHKFRYFYFLGRILSFTLAGLFAGAAGSVLHLFLQRYHISAAACFLVGGLIIILGIYSLIGWQYPGYHWIAKRLARVNHTLSLLMLRDRPWPSFLFGFFTVTLPCGQTLIVFSACALSGDLWIGLWNGFAFAVLTSPSLFLAMHANTLLSRIKNYYRQILGGCALLIGTLSILRGLADLNLIEHWILNPQSPSYWHIVVY